MDRYKGHHGDYRATWWIRVQYIARKRKAIEHTGDVTTQQFVIMGAQPDATAEDWERRNNPDPKDKLQ